MEVLLTIYSGEKEYFSREMSLPCVIGRGKQCDVTIVHPLISRRHCEFYEENGVVMARDLGSLNGTFFRNARIGRGVALNFGDAIAIGRLMLRVDPVGAPPSDDSEFAPAPQSEEKLTKTPSQDDSEPAEPEDDQVAELVDFDDLVSDEPKFVKKSGGDSSVIDLESYLNKD